MLREAILHIPMSNYAHGIDEKHVLFRIRTGKGDIISCTLFYGDRSCRHTPVILSSTPMQIVAQDDYYDYYEINLESPYTRICYYFELSDGIESVYYYSDVFTKELVDDRSWYYQFPFNRREDIADIPAWVKDAIIYNIFPDSFATSEEYISKKETTCTWEEYSTKGKLGGTIRGITENVGYLRELGINCIYINPIFVAGEYHKYDILDYYHIDPCFGTNEEFKTMVDTFHDNGIHVIIDGVFNHCSWKFFAFEDVVINGENSKYKDWFYGVQFPVIRPDNMEDYPNYDCFGYERLMPKLNTSNKEVLEYFLDVCKYWLKEYDIDGWRLDVASEVDDDFWREFRKAAKLVKPDCFLIGEVWESANHWLRGDQFDSTMNYDFRKNCKLFFADQVLDSAGFDSRVTQMRMRYHKNMLYGQLNLLDSHDVSRFRSLCKEDSRKHRLAVLFQMTFIGAPSIFYGDEKKISGCLEEDYRKPMIWKKSSSNEMYDFYRMAIQLRTKHEALRIGDYRSVFFAVGRMLYAFERISEQESILVIMNAGNIPERIDFNTTGEILMQLDYSNDVIGAYGYLVVKRKPFGDDK